MHIRERLRLRRLGLSWREIVWLEEWRKKGYGKYVEKGLHEIQIIKGKPPFSAMWVNIRSTYRVKPWLRGLSIVGRIRVGAELSCTGVRKGEAPGSAPEEWYEIPGDVLRVCPEAYLSDPTTRGPYYINAYYVKGLKG